MDKLNLHDNITPDMISFDGVKIDVENTLIKLKQLYSNNLKVIDTLINNIDDIEKLKLVSLSLLPEFKSGITKIKMKEQNVIFNEFDLIEHNPNYVKSHEISKIVENMSCETNFDKINSLMNVNIH